MRYTGPRNKLARREKIDLELKTAGSKAHSNLLRRINIPPGQHGTKRFRRRTEYGSQLREKQKLKRIYGLTEKQLRGYFIKAERVTGNTADLLVSQLEMRLDNVIYKLGFTPTRPSARQLVNHGHVAVNGKKVTIPSYQVKSGDIITFHKQKTIKIPYITQMIEK
ncbi:MAG: 30S ribosomal protein S4 [Candidatus Paceibacterota bacterium]